MSFRERIKKGFTLIEVIIVIIIIGVLASLALPRFFQTIEYSKGSEALASLGAVRQSMERCYLSNQNYTSCAAITSLDVSDPSSSPGAHFTYEVVGTGSGIFTLRANRTTFDGGSVSGAITFVAGASGVTRSGGGAFVGIK